MEYFSIDSDQYSGRARGFVKGDGGRGGGHRE